MSKVTTSASTSAGSFYTFLASSMDMTDFSTTYDDRASFQTVFNTVATGRKTYKTLKEKQEVIWPPCLEAALIDALEKYRPNSLTDPKDLRRFPRRNQFISEHIFQITGKRRTPKQVGSRLQQLRDTCSSEHILYLLDRRIFENSDESSAGGEAGPSRCSLISPKRANPYPYRASHPNPMQASNQDETAVLSPGIRPKPPLLCCSIPHSVAYACSDLESVPVSFSLQAPMDYHPNTPLEDYTQPNVALTDFSGSVATKQPLSPGIIGLYCPNSAPPPFAATSGPQMDPHKSFSHWLLNGAGQEGRESPQSTSSPLNPAFPLSIAPDDTSATYMHLQRLTEQAFPALQGNASPVEANLLATPPQLLVDISFVSMTPSPRPPLSPGDANSLLSDSQTATSFIPMTGCEREQWLRRSSSSMAIGHHDIHRIKAGIPAGFGIHELRPSGTFVSSRVLDYQLLRSIFRAYIGSILVYSEVVGVEPKYVQGQGGSAPYFYYTSKILPSFWEQLTIAHDLSRCRITQEIVTTDNISPTNEFSSPSFASEAARLGQRVILSIVYSFDVDPSCLMSIPGRPNDVGHPAHLATSCQAPLMPSFPWSFPEIDAETVASIVAHSCP